MAPRKPKPAPIPEPVVPEPVVPEPVAVVQTFAELDPVDGRPVFAEGLSRRRWLELHADERKAELVDALRSVTAESDDAQSL
jgi:hypothetical protein